MFLILDQYLVVVFNSKIVAGATENMSRAIMTSSHLSVGVDDGLNLIPLVASAVGCGVGVGATAARDRRSRELPHGFAVF